MKLYFVDAALSRLELVSCPTPLSPLSGGEGKSVLVDKDVEEMYFTYRHDSQKRDRGLMTLRHSRMRSTSTCTSPGAAVLGVYTVSSLFHFLQLVEQSRCYDFYSIKVREMSIGG